ncbi:MAG: hypothetical protein AAB036_07170 [Elusimicrobiota bacterium]
MMILPLAVVFSFGLSAQPTPTLPDMPVSRSTPGWSKQGRSLLLHDENGNLSSEIGLSQEDSGPVTREVRGGPSPDARAAWTLERRLTWNSPRTKLLESRRLLKIHGSTGQLLWSDDAADIPEQGDPVAFSNSSKVVLIAKQLGESWGVEARDWAGGLIVKSGPFSKVIAIRLSPAGQYALIRWAVPDKSDTHTFLDLTTKTRKDIETSEMTLGLARIGDDGVVRSGRREVFRFSAEKSTPSSAPDVAK